MLRRLLTFTISFCRNWKILLMSWWFVYSMFLLSGVDAASFLVPLELKCFLSLLCVWSWSARMLFPAAVGTFSCRLAGEYPTSDLESGRTSFLDAIRLLFFFIGIHLIDQRSQTSLRDFTTPRIARHQAWSRFRHRRASFEVVFWPLFDMALCFVTWSSERKSLKWQQEHIEKLIMLNKRRMWFHSSLEKLPLVNMSASCFLVSTYLIWILGSKLILSNNQSDATLWFLETCLIVGLRLLIFILITLFRNERDFRERFDSAAVSESVSISMTNLLDTGLPVPVCCTFNEPRGTSWLSDLVFPGFQMQLRQARWDPLHDISIPNSSSALILLWLFLHLYLLVFFSTSLWRCWWSWNG